MIHVLNILIVLWFAHITVMPALYFKAGLFKRFYHDIMGWHLPDDSPQTFDGCSIHARCKYCGQEIMQDSQGNWF